MIRFAKPHLLFAVLSITCWGQSAQISITKPVHGIPTRQKAEQSTPQASTTNNGILYWGGPVMNLPSGTNVYFIWYGNWSSNPGAKQILTDLVQRLGGSPYFNINTTYYDIDKAGQQDPVFNKVNYIASVNDNYSMGQSLSDFDVLQLVANHTGTDLPIDENGVFFVHTSPDVSQQESAGNGGPFCAWHSYALVAYPNFPGRIFNIKVAWIGDPHNYVSLCGVQDPSPNNNPDVDSMASFTAHELEESVTDPDINAWLDSNGNENADKCQFTFGCTFTGYGYTYTGPQACRQTSNGAYYNMNLGNRSYMIQQNWVNANGGYCALRW